MNVTVNGDLANLVEVMEKKLSSQYERWYSMPRPYEPHVTLVFQDLTAEGYERGKKYLEGLSFQKEIEANHVALVEMASGVSIEYKRFYFGEGS